jgi:Xaa-Pro aminopeptidase
VADARRLTPALQKLGKAGKRVMLDPASCPVALVDALTEGGDAEVVERRDPVLLPKAKKNEVEISGMREAQSLDSVAMAKFLRWFDAEVEKGELTEPRRWRASGARSRRWSISASTPLPAPARTAPPTTTGSAARAIGGWCRGS